MMQAKEREDGGEEEGEIFGGGKEEMHACTNALPIPFKVSLAHATPASSPAEEKGAREGGGSRIHED